jgi:hypothetical protein
MALTDDDRNQTQGHIEEVSSELGDFSQVVMTATVEADQWETIKGSTVEAAMFVSWLADHIKE